MARTRLDNQMIVLSIHLVFENDCANALGSLPQSPFPRPTAVWIVARAGHASGRETSCTCRVFSSVGSLSPFLPVSAAVLRSPWSRYGSGCCTDEPVPARLWDGLPAAASFPQDRTRRPRPSPAYTYSVCCSSAHSRANPPSQEDHYPCRRPLTPTWTR